jgi:tyrosyl-tRNA synthetase
VRPLVAVCLPLLIGTDGTLKMSKSVGNSILIDEAPNEQYGKLMSIPDSLITNYFTLLTDISNEELGAIEKGIADGSMHPMETKKRLARTIVSMLHGEEAADGAQAEFERVFQQRQQPGETQDLPVALNGDPTEIDITLVLSEAGIVGSRGEARRLVQQGALSVDEQKVEKAQVLLAEGSIVKVGRHRFYKVVKAGQA